MEDFWLWFTLLVGGGGAIFAVISAICAVAATIIPFVLIGWWIWKRSKQRDAVRQSAQMWPATTGRVIKSRVEVSGGETTTVSARVIYAYDVNGRAYQSEQLRAGDSIMRMTSGQEAYALVDRYPEGAIVTVYYNPLNPQEAALER